MINRYYITPRGRNADDANATFGYALGRMRLMTE